MEYYQHFHERKHCSLAVLLDFCNGTAVFLLLSAHSNHNFPFVNFCRQKTGSFKWSFTLAFRKNSMQIQTRRSVTTAIVVAIPPMMPPVVFPELGGVAGLGFGTSRGYVLKAVPRVFVALQL